jgi:hypothetical protein
MTVQDSNKVDFQDSRNPEMSEYIHNTLYMILNWNPAKSKAHPSKKWVYKAKLNLEESWELKGYSHEKCFYWYCYIAQKIVHVHLLFFF